MQVLVILIMVSSTVLNIFNMFAGFVSGIWLAILSEWWAIGYGVAGWFLSIYFLAILLSPSLLLSAPGMVLLDKGKTLLAAPFLLLGQLYTGLLISGWCLGIFVFFMSRVDPDNYIPLLLWSYGTALGPWVVMARKQLVSNPSALEFISIFYAEVAYIIIALMFVFGYSILFSAIIFLGIMAIGTLVQFGVAFAMLQRHQRLSLQ